MGLLFTQSGWPDLNRRPLAPEASALPGYATPRCLHGTALQLNQGQRRCATPDGGWAGVADRVDCANRDLDSRFRGNDEGLAGTTMVWRGRRGFSGDDDGLAGMTMV